MKKSFVLFNDSLEILSELTNEEAGILFKAITSFNLGKEMELDKNMRMLFLPFKNQFIRDLEKYKTTSKRNADNGSKGGLAKVANATKRKRTLKSVATLADSDKDSDKDSDTYFEFFRKKYPGTKNGFETEYENFKKKNSDWKEIIPQLMPALEYQIKIRNEKSLRNEFIAPWKNLQTWINQKCWLTEIPMETKSVWPEYKKGDPVNLSNPFCGKPFELWTQEEKAAHRYKQQEA